MQEGAPKAAPSRAQRYRNICFTIPHPKGTPLEFQESIFSIFKTSYMVFQLEEAPTTKLPHWQGYVEFNSQYTIKGLNPYFQKGHLSPRMGTALQAADYCRLPEEADGTSKGRIDGPWERGKISAPGERTDIQNWIDEAIQNGAHSAAQRYPDTHIRNRNALMAYAQDILPPPPRQRDVTVTLLYGPGGAGKNHYVYVTSEPEPSPVHRVPKDLNNRTPYAGQKAIFIDEFAGDASGACQFDLNQLLDKWPVELKGLYANTPAHWTRVYIGTNYHPARWYNWRDTPSWIPFARRIGRICLWDFARPNEPRDPDEIIEGKEACYKWLMQ